MFTEKAFELIKELSRSPDIIPPFDDDGVRQVLEEMKAIFEENCKEVENFTTSGDRTLWPLLNYRHAALQRNKRCLLAYVYQRLKKVRAIRWEFGPVIPDDIKKSLCEPETQWFNSYSKALSSYMRAIGEGTGIDLTCNLKPPKSLYVAVRCMEDYGKFELEDGHVVLLQKDTQHYLPRAEVEGLIKLGILKHVT